MSSKEKDFSAGKTHQYEETRKMLAKRSKGNDCLFGLINVSIIPNDIDEEEKMEILAELKTSKIEQEFFMVNNYFADELDTFFRHI